eukprot:NODE_1457_length_1524_cov_45.379661_g1315_i0.p1 GENE.NODE_1457_length_1524_cov_45.379661_g1315_i0~~NODE_1457_length_1524_cov_45.379661_g1315_i0.p1  ORF type:complete len:344 (+),score=54.28 NODE_1457_length_1524_cov_45.379661_g1315_i0:216-1247(+)
MTLNNILLSLVNSGWQLRDLLVQDVLSSNGATVSPLTVDSDLSLGETLKNMATQNAVSAHVMTSRNTYFGTVTVKEILFEVLEALEQSYRGTLKEQGGHTVSQYQFSMSDRTIIEGVLAKPLRSMSLVKTNICNNTDAVTMVIRDVMLPNNFFSMAVFSAPDKISAMLNRMDLVNFVTAYPDVFGEFANKTVQELGLIRGFVRTMNQRETMMDAFEIMRQNGVSAVPVVNSKGKLVTCIDPIDLRGLSNFFGLRLQVAFFKSSVPNPEDFPPDMIPLPMPLTCSPNDTLKDVVLRMARAREQRAWCVNDEMKPLCAISTTHIFKMLTDPSPVEVQEQQKFARV